MIVVEHEFYQMLRKLTVAYISRYFSLAEGRLEQVSILLGSHQLQMYQEHFPQQIGSLSHEETYKHDPSQLIQL